MKLKTLLEQLDDNVNSVDFNLSKELAGLHTSIEKYKDSQISNIEDVLKSKLTKKRIQLSDRTITVVDLEIVKNNKQHDDDLEYAVIFTTDDNKKIKTNKDFQIINESGGPNTNTNAKSYQQSNQHKIKQF